MRRQLFTFAAIVSLALCLACTLIGIRSFWISDSFERFDGAYEPYIFMNRTIIASARGGLQFMHLDAQWRGGFAGAIDTGHTRAWVTDDALQYPYFSEEWHVETRKSFAGFELAFERRDEGEHGNSLFLWSITMPIAALIPIFALLPALKARRMLRDRRRYRVGICPTCGYDLRATPERCPECGREATAS